MKVAGRIAAVALVLAACGGGQRVPDQPARGPADSTADSIAAGDTVRAAVLATLRQPFLGDLDSMRQRRIIRVLVPYSRTFFFWSGARERGTAAEAFREFEQWLNRRDRTERTPTAIVFLPVPRDRLLTDLVAGRGDVAAGGLTITEQRQRAVAFTRPVLRGVDEIVVSGPGAPALASLDDLSGREVYVRASSSYAESAARLNERLAAAGRPAAKVRAAPEDLEDEDILELVDAGAVPFTIVDDYLARFWATVFDSLTLHPELALAREGDLAYAVRTGSPQLRAALDEFGRTHGVGTTFGSVIFARYLRENRWARSTAGDADQRRARALVGLFRRYAERYRLDPVLLMAQGYQESRLLQETRSHAGAVGIMQLLPTTAAGRPISIADISSPEANIHAGAKYMRYLMDTYFADTALAPGVQQVFALAAYNAGPGRVASLRRKAAAQGLDPNRWVRNVELVAAREIGTETTTYVSNILKYYAAYQVMLESEAEATATRP